jgi:hypothetical protein
VFGLVSGLPTTLEFMVNFVAGATAGPWDTHPKIPSPFGEVVPVEKSLDEAVWAMNEGYCLWVGAGVSRQIAGGKASVPLWGALTKELESAAGVLSAEEDDFPTRLDRCKAHLGEAAFRRFLRERYYTELCCAVLSQAAATLDGEEFVPENAVCLAALGQMANPITNFNIEPLSSLLLGRPCGPFLLRFQQSIGKRSLTWREQTAHFQRLVYHPHGLATADTVMTANEYDANRQTLAFGVAIHACFDNRLAIVGMSLDDHYLREQIEQFRANIGPIYWFNSQFPDELASWAERSDIVRVCCPWSDFWQFWRGLVTDKSIQFDGGGLETAWYLAVSQAVEETDGGYLAGEPGKKHLIDGREPGEIAGRVHERLMAAGFQVPVITKWF